MKKGGGSRKGSAFERLVCVRLSQWFSHGERTDLFWRTSGSGARSTVKAKTGQTIANSAGDIRYADIEGKPLIDIVTFELKAGYRESESMALLELLPNRKLTMFGQFIDQAIESSKQVNTPYWAVIQKRNQKEILIHVPNNLIAEISLFLDSDLMGASLSNKIIPSQTTLYSYKDEVLDVFSTTFDLFCQHVPPDFFKQRSPNI
jgi:hypothetical protein